ncbi:MAG: hypothetical protein Q4A04_05180 [Eubacteriales bacterium]|nr:hypothetical protein [Eubacteriales bacterium]
MNDHLKKRLLSSLFCGLLHGVLFSIFYYFIAHGFDLWATVLFTVLTFVFYVIFWEKTFLNDERKNRK